MQGTEETELVSQKNKIDHCKKIIRFSIKFSQKNFSQRVKKNYSNKTITRKMKVINLANISKKRDCFPLKNKPYLSLLCPKDNLIPLIAFIKNNFKYKFSQKLSCCWDIKVMYPPKVPWASNSPRYAINVSQD